MKHHAQDKYTLMTTAPIPSLIGSLAVPTIISMLVTSFYVMVDTYFVGKINTQATAAVGISFSVMAIIQAFGFFFGHGSGNYISRKLGARDFKSAEKMAATGFFSAFVMGCLITLAGELFLTPICRELGSTPTILPYTETYLGIILLGAPFMASSLVLNNQMRFQGNAVYAMVGITAGTVLNIGLAPLMIFVFGMGIAGAAWAGAAIVLAVIMAASRKIGDNTVLLVLGMMLGAGIDSVVMILQYLSDEQALKSYIVWTMGALGNISGARLWIMAGTVLAGAAVAGALCKPLNLLLTGENYAASAGTDVRQTRSLVFAATVLLAGTVTAFCGPLGFIGLAVPHLARLFTGTADHRILVPGTALYGSCIMLACDIAAKSAALPVNAVTSLAGIPVVIWIVLGNRRRGF